MADDRQLPRVLVVDDEEHISEMVAMGLGFNGFEVERAASGRAALAAAEARRPDLIVLDVREARPAGRAHPGLRQRRGSSPGGGHHGPGGPGRPDGPPPAIDQAPADSTDA